MENCLEIIISDQGLKVQNSDSKKPKKPKRTTKGDQGQGRMSDVTYLSTNLGR